MEVMERPAVLLFDEHTAALDPHMGRDGHAADRRDRTRASAHHRHDHAQHALRGSYGDRLLTMSRGRIVDDVPRAAQKDHLDEEQLIARSRKHLVGEVIDHLLG